MAPARAGNDTNSSVAEFVDFQDGLVRLAAEKRFKCLVGVGEREQNVDQSRAVNFAGFDELEDTTEIVVRHRVRTL